MKSNQRNRLEQKRPLYFTIGLATSLCIVYALFQIKTTPNTRANFPKGEPVTIYDADIPVTTTKTPQPPPKVDVVKVARKNVFKPVMIQVPNNWKVEDGSDSLFHIDPVDFPTGEPVIEVDMVALDKKPIFPGCAGILDEKSRFECFQQKMIAFVQKHYRPCETAFGTVNERIILKFTIDENGKSRNPQIIRGEDACNAQEAINLVGRLPVMQPGMYRGKFVKTSFVLPIHIK